MCGFTVIILHVCENFQGIFFCLFCGLIVTYSVLMYCYVLLRIDTCTCIVTYNLLVKFTKFEKICGHNIFCYR